MQKESNFKIDVEQFKPLPTNQFYLVSDKGRIYSKKSKRFLSNVLHWTGYVVVGIRCDGKQRSRVIHQLVMEAFVGPRDSKLEINHVDGNKKNNRLSNLEYCTKSANTKHAISIGLRGSQKGEKNHNSKLSDLQVEEIRMQLQNPRILQKELAKKYNVSRQLIGRIKHGLIRPV